MLCHIFESVPGTRVLHEPDAPLHLSRLQEQNSFNDSQYDAMLKSTFRVLSKSHLDVKMICIKPRPRSLATMKDISRLLPNIKHLFLYRNSLNNIKSLLGMMYCEPFPGLLCSCAYSEWFSKICSYYRRLLAYMFIAKLKDFQEVPANANSATCGHTIFLSQKMRCHVIQTFCQSDTRT